MHGGSICYRCKKAHLQLIIFSIASKWQRVVAPGPSHALGIYRELFVIVFISGHGIQPMTVTFSLQCRRSPPSVAIRAAMKNSKAKNLTVKGIDSRRRRNSDPSHEII